MMEKIDKWILTPVFVAGGIVLATFCFLYGVYVLLQLQLGEPIMVADPMILGIVFLGATFGLGLFIDKTLKETYEGYRPTLTKWVSVIFFGGCLVVVGLAHFKRQPIVGYESISQAAARHDREKPVADAPNTGVPNTGAGGSQRK